MDDDGRNEPKHCPYVSRCPMFGEFASRSTLRIFQIHYCHGDHGKCERFRKASQGVMPPPNLLPDGSELRPRPPGRKPE